MVLSRVPSTLVSPRSSLRVGPRVRVRVRVRVRLRPSTLGLSLSLMISLGGGDGISSCSNSGLST